MGAGTESNNQETWSRTLAKGETVQWRQRLTWGWVLFGAITLVLLVRMAGVFLQGLAATGELVIITIFWLGLIVYFMSSSPKLLRRRMVRIGSEEIAITGSAALTWAQIRDVRVLGVLGRKRVQLVLVPGAMHPQRQSWWGRRVRSADPRGRWVLLPDWLPVDPEELATWLALELRRRKSPPDVVIPQPSRRQRMIKTLRRFR